MALAEKAFECFGGWAQVQILGAATQEPGKAAAAAESQLLDAHRRLSRFLPMSELSRLNADPRETVPASPLLIELAAAAHEAGRISDGIVDATLVREIELAGYAESHSRGPDRGKPTAASAVSGLWRRRRRAGPSPRRGWEQISVDREAGTISRPVGLAIDSGGIAKGLLADLIATRLGRFRAFVVDCCGDVRIGGSGGKPRPIRIESPFGPEPIHTLAAATGGVATSGISRRNWTSGESGEEGHHLLDPATGSPAFTGLVQVTALAPTALLAEIHAKWALLSGPAAAASRLPFGGVLVDDELEVEVVAASRPEPALPL